MSKEFLYLPVKLQESDDDILKVYNKVIGCPGGTVPTMYKVIRHPGGMIPGVGGAVVPNPGIIEAVGVLLLYVPTTCVQDCECCQYYTTY